VLTEAATDLRARYERDGYCVARNVIPAEVVERGLAGMDAIRRGEYDTGTPPIDSPWKPGDPREKFCKIEMPHIGSAAVRALLTHPALGAAAAAVTGAKRVQIWWVQMLEKPPGAATAGVNVGWHQDAQYWKCWEPGSELFTAWVAMSDVTEDSGPVRFVPGSHRWGFLDQGDFYGQDPEALRSGIGVPEGQTWREEAAILSPGDVSFHHCWTYHGSGPNLSGRFRRSFAVHMRTEKSRPIPDVSVLGPDDGGGLIQFLGNAEYNPIIYDARDG
jgi:ectoine hydroxylase-related dioxygenase (phytanoyl-CoA dioxygenase family)